MKLPLARIAEITGGMAGEVHRDAFATGYSIDSRTLQPGDLFFAIKGEHFDGHDYVNAALDRGAVAAVVHVSQAARFGDQRRIIAVPDTLDALQKLGRAVRRMWNKTVIAITGSAGKTTTKESAARLLSAKYRVLKSEGNLNNHYGLPLQLLRLEPEHQLAVLELGMNHAGEIRALAALCEPNVGVVTCVAPVHLGFFNSVADIARTKYELIQSLPATGTAVLNADDEYVSQFGRDFSGRVITFGIHHPADVRAEAIRELGPDGSEFDVVAGAAHAHARLRLIGRHNIYNALGAIAVALFGGLTLEEATSGVALFTPADKRGQILTVGGATVINDTYNSNPRALDLSWTRWPAWRSAMAAAASWLPAKCSNSAPLPTTSTAAPAPIWPTKRLTSCSASAAPPAKSWTPPPKQAYAPNLSIRLNRRASGWRARSAPATSSCSRLPAA